MLTGGNPRSLGRTDEVIQLVLSRPEKLEELFDCQFADDEIVRMRASDGLEKICREHPEWFDPYKQRMFDEVSSVRQPSVQWHLAQMFCEMSLTDAEKKRAVQIMTHNLESLDEWVVTNLTIEALATFVRRGDFERAKFVEILKKFQSSRHNSVARRAQKLLAKFA